VFNTGRQTRFANPEQDIAMFSQALVRPPGPSFAHGLTAAGLGRPDLEKARAQHRGYVAALEQCGLKVTTLKPLADYPDATFVEDTAVMTRDGAVISRPGAPTRRVEAALIRPAIEKVCPDIHAIAAPGRLDGGDVLAVGNRYYIGLSKRTNAEGAAQLIRYLRRRGADGSAIGLKGLLHLKTGVSWLGGNTLLTTGELTDCKAFAGYERITAAPGESYAANVIRVNAHVIMPGGHPRTRKKIEAAGYSVIAVDVTEFQKMDGGVSCLSLRF
jgi:dimethylargininase